MIGFNQVTLIGYIGDAPRPIETKYGKMIAFTLATTERGFKKKDGTKTEDKTEWHNITAYGKLAEIGEKILHKGVALFVQGKLRNRQYTGKDGINRRICEIQAETLQLLTLKEKAQENQNNGANSQSIGADSDDVPF